MAEDTAPGTDVAPPPRDGPGGLKVALHQSVNGRREGCPTSEFEEAIENHWVSLDHLIEALDRRRTSRDPECRALYDRYFSEMRQAYDDSGNRIEESYFCQNLRGGALLTKHTTKKRWRSTTTYRIHIRYPTESVCAVTPHFANALWRCMSLSKRATQLLRTQNSIAIHKSMYSVVVYLLSVLDAVETSSARATAESRAGGQENLPQERVQTAIDHAQKRLDEAGRQFDVCTRWGSNFAYFKGMLLGLVVLAVAGLAALEASGETADVEMFLAVISAGGAGAIISAMSRMGSDAFYLDPLAEHRGVALLGAFRPLIGAVFGAATFLVIEGGLLDVVPASVGDAEPTRTFFFAALGFLAGFNERFATGVLSRAGAAAGDTTQHMPEASSGSTGAVTNPPGS